MGECLDKEVRDKRGNLILTKPERRIQKVEQQKRGLLVTREDDSEYARCHKKLKSDSDSNNTEENPAPRNTDRNNVVSIGREEEINDILDTGKQTEYEEADPDEENVQVDNKERR